MCSMMLPDVVRVGRPLLRNRSMQCVCVSERERDNSASEQSPGVVLAQQLDEELGVNLEVGNIFCLWSSKESSPVLSNHGLEAEA